jgi:predicted peroxiredoxin
MKSFLFRSVPAVVLGVLLAQVPIQAWLAAPRAAADTSSNPGQRIVVHLSQSAGDPALHSALMGLGLATAMRQQGADVVVMLDSEAPALARKDWAEKTMSTAKHDPAHPPMMLGKVIQRFVDAGGKIVMCPHCAASCGCEVGKLADGAHFAAQGELTRVVLEADKILDY